MCVSYLTETQALLSLPEMLQRCERSVTGASRTCFIGMLKALCLFLECHRSGKVLLQDC